MTQYSTNKLKENVFDYLPVTFFVEGYSLNAAPHANKAGLLVLDLLVNVHLAVLPLDNGAL